MNLPSLRPFSPTLKRAILLFIILRLFLSGWAITILTILPTPDDPNERLRPYLGEPILNEGITGLLLGPWQRFDAQRYLRIARQGYTAVEDSVFPPLYPTAIALLSQLAGNTPQARLLFAILLSNGATLTLFYWLHEVTERQYGADVATRTLIYFALFPTSFFLFAPYTESIFILFALGSLWTAQNGRFSLAGILGGLAALTRLTGWILIIPLFYEYIHQHQPIRTRQLFTQHLIPLTAISLPALTTITFFLWRWAAGLPPLNVIYATHWYQTTTFPGVDLLTAVRTFFFNGPARAGEFTFYFDFACALFLILTTFITFRRLGTTYALYSLMLLLFILLPTSAEKPLFSFSRYTIAFFPAFILLGMAGKRPWLNRLILYPSLTLYLYFSGQLFIWGWVA